MKRTRLSRKTAIKKRSARDRARKLYLCDELARIICMVNAGAAWEAPDHRAWLCRTWFGACQCCGVVSVLQWSHYVSRTRIRVRHEPDNTHAICVRCHKRFTHNQPAFRAWMIEFKGLRRVEALEMLARNQFRTDLTILAQLLERTCRNLGAGDHVDMAKQR